MAVKSIVDKIDLPAESFISRYISMASQLTDAPVEFHLGAGLTALSTVCGSKIIFPGYGGRRQWLNLYTLLIAPSGLYRKSTSIGIAEDLIAAVDPTLILSGEQSREKFLSLLKTNPNVIYPISEFAAILAMWQRDYQAGMREIIVDLFDCRQEYSRQTLKDGRQTIHQPALNILAASTLDWLKEKLTEGDLKGGLMGRFILIPGVNKGVDKGLNPFTDKEARTNLINFLQSIRSLDKAWVDVTMILEKYNIWVKKMEKEITQEENQELIGFQSRLASHTLKLAILFCISELGAQDKYVLTEDHLSKAIILGRWLIEQAVTLAETGFIKSRTELQVQKMLKLASRNGGIQRTEALQRMHLTAREFDQMIQTIVERGQIKIERPKHSTKPVMWYTAVAKAEQPAQEAEQIA